MAERKEIVIENAELVMAWRNFSGKNSKFGNSRDFTIRIPNEKMATDLINDGWNVKVKPPVEEGEEPFAYLRIKTRFDHFPPSIYMIADKIKTPLNENTVGELDTANIITANIVVSGSYYETPSGATGISAYLKTGYFEIEKDPFFDKYNF